MEEKITYIWMWSCITFIIAFLCYFFAGLIDALVIPCTIELIVFGILSVLSAIIAVGSLIVLYLISK